MITRRYGDRPASVAEGLALSALALTAGLVYGWHLERQGWGNAYYAATAQAGASSWKAFYFGSVDAGNALSTDKPPVGLWPMAASVRVFGLSSWSVLAPQLVQAVATVVVLARTVRRHSGRAAGLLAAVVLAFTPVFVVLARFDDPDITVTLLSVCVAYTTTRYLEHHHPGWITTTGALLGLLFLTKWGAGLLVVPAVVAVVWRSRARAGVSRGAPLLLAGGVAVGVTAIWLPAVLLVPARWRPYQDASGGNVLNLVLGQNGFSRMVTRAPESLSAVVISGTPGPLRLFQPPFTGQVAWLLPLAVVLGVLPAALGRARAPARVTMWPGSPDAGMFWSAWLFTTAVVFSVMGGPMHPYYTVLMAPAIAALTAAGLVALWRAARVEGQAYVGVVLAVVLVGSLLWEAHVAGVGALLIGTALAVLLTATVCWVTLGGVKDRGPRTGPVGPRARFVVAAVIVVPAMLAGPVAFSLATDTHAVTGANPLAGPDGGQAAVVYPPALVEFLRARSTDQTWAAATPRATAASTLALATGRPVLTLGGFTGNVASPTLDVVRAWVNQGRVRYLVLSATALAALPTPAVAESQAGQVVHWGVTHGCPVAVAEMQYVVLDLAGKDCAPGSAPVGQGIRALSGRSPGGRAR